MGKWFLRIGALVLALGVLALILGWTYLNSQKIDYDRSLSIEGINNQVDVYYDQFGIPHIYGQSLGDVYKAFGYVHAKDRLWQMELLRRIAPGRLSELFGAATVETDHFFKTIGLHDQSRREASRFMSKEDSDLKILVNSYISGVNHFIAEGKLPIEYAVIGSNPEPFTLTDIYNIMGYMAFSFNVAHKTEPIANFIASELGVNYLNALDLHIDTSTTMILSDIDRRITDLSLHIDEITSATGTPAI